MTSTASTTTWRYPLAPVVAAPAVEVNAATTDAMVLEAAAIQGTARLRREAARSAQRHDYAAVSAAHLRMSAVLQAAPASDRIVAEQAAHVAFVAADDGPMAAADVLRLAERGFTSGRRRGRRERKGGRPHPRRASSGRLFQDSSDGEGVPTGDDVANRGGPAARPA